MMAVVAVVALPAATFASPTLARQDILWLDRITYGPTSATLERYLKLGRRRFLDEQLHPRDQQLPAAVAAQLDALEISP
jgi:hypothetical protein